MVVIVEAVRTAIGKIGGSLKDIEADVLTETVIREVIDRSKVEISRIDEVIFGQTKQSQDAPNIARVALLKAGLPFEIHGYTVNRQCGSGMQAIYGGFLSIIAEQANAVIAGGVESMSTAPYYIRKARFGYGAGNGEIIDPNTESQPRSQPIEQYGNLTMGLTAENLAEKYNISREEQDQYALESQIRALKAINEGRFKEEIVPVLIPQRKKQPEPFCIDEHPRKTSLEQLAKLKPVFKDGGTVTAGSSSGRNDGASALLLMNDQLAKEMDMKTMAKIISFGVAGVSPEIMGIGPVPAIKLALKRANLQLEDIDLFEINEAFAAQTLAVLRELSIPNEKLNVNGGAIALGHPIGNSGSRIVVTLLHEMQKRNVRYGVAALCIAGGMGIAMVVENTLF